MNSSLELHMDTTDLSSEKVQVLGNVTTNVHMCAIGELMGLLPSRFF